MEKAERRIASGRPFRKAPELPGASGLWGHVGAMRNDRLGLLEVLARRGDAVAKLRVGATAILIVNEPGALHQLLAEKAKAFEKSPVLRSVLYPLAGLGLFTSEGELWRTQRKRMAPLFQPSQLGAYADVMRNSAAEAASALAEGEPVEVLSLTTRIAMRVAGRALFDADTLSEADELGEALTTALAWANELANHPATLAQARLRTALELAARRDAGLLGRAARRASDALLPPLLWPGERKARLRRALAAVDPRVRRMIEERRASAPRPGSAPRRPDLLARLLDVEEGERPMDEKQVRDEIVTLFVAGHETTATALAWALYLLSRDPEQEARVVAEARALPSDPGHADLPALPLAARVFKEAMRLYPPVPLFGRQAMEDVELAGYAVPAGTVCLVSPYALHRRPDLWPDPERFDPDRFLPARETERHRYAYLPFSGGPRTCIGNFFALTEGPIVLATLLRRLRFVPESSARAVPVVSSTLRPPPLWMRVEKRL